MQTHDEMRGRYVPPGDECCRRIRLAQSILGHVVDRTGPLADIELALLGASVEEIVTARNLRGNCG